MSKFCMICALLLLGSKPLERDELELAVYRTLVALPAAWCERDTETPEARAERLRAVARALVEATHDRDRLAAGITIAWAETKLAQYVEHDCRDKPKQCSGNCDKDRHGKVRARTYFQLQERACPELFRQPTGSQQALDVAADCATRLWAYHRKRCASLVKDIDAGAFAGYAGLPCQATAFDARAPLYRQIKSQLDREIWKARKERDRGRRN